jgi:hypothetical protein
MTPSTSINVYMVRVVIALIIPIGLLLHSNVVRYLGGAYFVSIAASVLWPLLTAKLVWSVGLIWVFAIGVLSLPLIWLLLISKKFSSEFTGLRNTEPKYMETLRAVMLLALVVAAIVATSSVVAATAPAASRRWPRSAEPHHGW